MRKRMVLLLSCCAIALGVGCAGVSYTIYSDVNKAPVNDTTSLTQTQSSIASNDNRDNSTSNAVINNETSNNVKSQTESKINSSVSNTVTSNKSTISNTTTQSKSNTLDTTKSSNSVTSSKSTNNSSNSAKNSETISVNQYEYLMNFCSDIAILEGPSANSGVVITVPGQTQVYVYSQSDGWSYVECQGVKGYIPTNELRYIPYAASNGYAVDMTGYIPGSFKGNAYIMSGMSENSSKIYSLRAGDSFYVLSECGSWFFVEVGDYSGFIPMSDVVFLNPAIPINKAHC